MRKMVVFMHTGYVGMDAAAALLVADDTTENEIGELAYEMAIDNAESFGIYQRDWDSDEDQDEDRDDDDNCYSDNIEGHAVDYNPELHDRHRAGGGSFKADFERMDYTV